MYVFIMRWIEFFVLAYFILVNAFYIMLYLASIPVLYRRYKEVRSEDFTRLLSSDSVPPISILIPGYNENMTFASTIRSALNVRYRHINVIAINDGSSDETMEILKKEFQLLGAPPASKASLHTETILGYYRSKKYPNLLVIDKAHGGKKDALNAGINACMTPYCLLIDSDTYLAPDICQRMMRPVLSQPNTIAVGGMIRVANGCVIKNGKVVEVRFPKTFLEGMQVIDYLRSFLYGRIGWSALGGQYLISGGFGLFRKDALLEAGGFKKLVGEDLEITLRLHEIKRKNKEPYKIDYLPDSVAWTEVPFTYQALRRQRERWHRSMLEVFGEFKHMLFNPKYGPIGFVQLPFLYILEFMSPIVETIGYLFVIFTAIIGALNLSFIWLFILFAWGLNILLTLFAFLMEQVSFRGYKRIGDILKVLGFILIENVGYRQLTVLWRLEGIFNFFTKKRSQREKGERLKTTQLRTEQ